MKKYFGFFILFTLLICLTSISAADIANNTQEQTSLSPYDTTTQANIETSNNISKQIIKEEKNNVKEKSQTIKVTNSNYNKYFQTTDLKTTSSVNSGDIIDLQGTFNNINFGVDKSNITITSIGKTAKLNNCTVYLNGVSSSYSQVSNLTITNTKDNCEGIIIENATHVKILNNNIFVKGSNDFVLTSYLMNNSEIKNNYFEANHTQTNMRIYASTNNQIINNTIIGSANGIYLCAYGQSNETNETLRSNNNIIKENTVIGKSTFSTCYPIQIMGFNNTVEKNSVNGGNRGISSENDNIIRNNTITNTANGIYTGGNSRIEYNTIKGLNENSIGVIASGSGSVIQYNKIQSDKNGIDIMENNITITNNNITSKNYSIYSKANRRGYNGINVINNTLIGSLYNTGNMTINGNTIKSGNSKEGGALYNTGNVILSGNEIIENTASDSVINNKKGKLVASNNIFKYNTPASFAIENNMIVMKDEGKFIPTDAKVSIYENGSLVKSTTMTKSNVDYTVSGTHTYNLIVDATNFTNNKFLVTNSKSAKQTTIAIDKIPVAYNATTLNISGKLLSGNTGIKGQQLAISINNANYTTKTGDNGVFSIKYNVNNLNTRVVKVSYDGSNDYKASTNSTTFNVKLNKTANIKITAPTSIDTGKTATFKLLITDADTNQKLNGTAIIKVNGLTLTDDNNKQINLKVVNGEATLNYSLRGYSARTHQITAVFAKKGYLRAENNTTMKVNKVNYATFSFVIKGCSEKVITINKTLKDANGNVLGGNNKIAIKVGDRTVLTTTTTNGVLNAKFTLPYLPAGTINVKITLGENYRYNMVIFNTTATIYKQNVTVTINSIKAKAGSTITLKAKLINSETKTNVISGRYIFKVNGKTVPLIENGKEVSTTKIVSNGIAQWDYKLPANLKAGTYEVLLAYNGNTQSNSIKYSSKALTITG